MCQGTVENWCADDDVNMAVRAGGNIEYGREPDFEGWIRWRQQEKMQQIVTGKATLEQLWQACWRGFVLLLLWAGSTVVGFAQLQSINYKVCKYFKVAKVTKSSARTNKTDAIGAVIIWRTAWRATVHISTTDKCNVCRHILAQYNVSHQVKPQHYSNQHSNTTTDPNWQKKIENILC